MIPGSEGRLASIHSPRRVLLGVRADCELRRLRGGGRPPLAIPADRRRIGGFLGRLAAPGDRRRSQPRPRHLTTRDRRAGARGSRGLGRPGWPVSAGPIGPAVDVLGRPALCRPTRGLPELAVLQPPPRARKAPGFARPLHQRRFRLPPVPGQDAPDRVDGYRPLQRPPVRGGPGRGDVRANRSSSPSYRSSTFTLPTPGWPTWPWVSW